MKSQRPLFLVCCFFVCICILCSCVRSGEAPNVQDSDAPEYRGELTFDGVSYTYKGDVGDISVKDDVISIVKGGKYLVSGKLSEGRLTVDADEKTTLVLSGVEMTSSYGAVIYTEGSSELVIEAKKDTVNVLSSKGSEKTVDGAPSACVCSRGVLTFSGEGRTVISTQRGAAAMSFLEIDVRDASLSVGASNYGLWARDLICIDGGRFTVSQGKNGVFASAIKVKSGMFTALCSETAIFAEKKIDILSGVASIDAPKAYKCGYYDKDKWVEGSIEIKSSGFPQK